MSSGKNESPGVKCVLDYAMTPNSQMSNKATEGVATPKGNWRRSRPGDPNSKV